MDGLIHVAQYARKSAVRASGQRVPVRFGAHFPTNGICAILPSVENEAKIVAANLKALMGFAEDHPEKEWPSTKKGLTERINAGRPADKEMARRTVQRAYGAKVAVQVDTLGALAAPFGLEAWHLLIPDLDPAQLPDIAVWRAAFRNLSAPKNGVRPERGLRAGSHAAGANPSSKSAKKQHRV